MRKLSDKIRGGLVSFFLLFMLFSNTVADDLGQDYLADDILTATLSPPLGHQIDECTLVSNEGVIRLWDVGQKVGGPR